MATTSPHEGAVAYDRPASLNRGNAAGVSADWRDPRYQAFT